MNWSKELARKVEMGEPDEKHAGGVYDLATDIALKIERVLGREFKDIDGAIEVIYDAVKYGN